MEPPEEDESLSLRHYCSGDRYRCRCVRCLRAFALTLRKRAVISLAEKALEDEIIVYSMSGEEYRIETLTGTSTFLDFYQQVRIVLGLPLRATSISLALVFQSAAPNRNIRPGGGAQFSPNEILEPLRVECRSLLKGCCFQALVSRPPQVVVEEVD